MHKFRRGPIALLVSVSFALVALVAVAPPATAADTDIKINEVRSDPTDTVEFVNTGTSTIDLAGYIFKDDDDTHSFPLPSGTTVPAGGHVAVDITPFGLGKGDSARLYTPDGLTLIDSTTWPTNTHATTWGRCPDGTGTFGVMTASLGAPNTCAVPDSAVKVNEFSSNNPDFVELVNTGTGAVDLSGWMLKDDTDNNAYTFPAGSSIAAGEYQGLDGENVDFDFGLGNGDSVRLYSDSDLTTPLDSYTYLAHPAAGKSYGRCPDGDRRVRGHRCGDPGRCQPVRGPGRRREHQDQRGPVRPGRHRRADQHRRDQCRHLGLRAQGQRRHPRLHDPGQHQPGRARLRHLQRRPRLRPGQGRLGPALRAERGDPARLHDVPDRHARDQLGPLPERHRRRSAS